MDKKPYCFPAASGRLKHGLWLPDRTFHHWCGAVLPSCLPATASERATHYLHHLTGKPRGAQGSLWWCPSFTNSSTFGKDQLEILRELCESWLADEDSPAVKHRLPEIKSEHRKEGECRMTWICPPSTPVPGARVKLEGSTDWPPAESRSSSWCVTSCSAGGMPHGSMGRPGPMLSWYSWLLDSSQTSSGRQLLLCKEEVFLWL